MQTPYVTIDTEKIERNASAIVELCGRRGIAVTGVTKGVCGDPDVARAMLRGGVISIADSKIDNVRRLKDAGIVAPIILLSVPAPSAVDEVIASADMSVNTELGVIEALGRAAVNRGKEHEVMLMVDLGDLREGLWPDELETVVGQAKKIAGIRIVGLGANLACFSGLAPTEQNMAELVRLADEIEARHAIALRWISGINSSGLALVESGPIPQGINHARIGEAILLGRETLRHSPWPGLHQDAFALYAEIVELKEKPSAFPGVRGEDAFGNRPELEDRGRILRALLNIGREDVLVEGLTPLAPELRILGGSSGYLVVDATAAVQALRVGDEIGFSMTYGALLATMTSDHVKKRVSKPRGSRLED